MKFVTIAIALLIFSTAAQAQQQNNNCAPRDMVLQRLGERYGESRQSIGLGGTNQVVEVFANLESGSWTITVTSSNGITCVVAAGMSFETLSENAVQGSRL